MEHTNISFDKCKSRNYLLELWRFLFCIMVLGLHFFNAIDRSLFRAGYLGVEFFFLVSGYFIGSYYEKHLTGKNLLKRLGEIQKYAASRLKRLYPLYLTALLAMLTVRTVSGHLGIRGMFLLVKSCFAEFIMLQWTPIGNEVLISADWYVPALFWGGIFFVMILALTGKAGGLLIAPLLSFCIYRYYFVLIGKIDIIVYHHCVLRGIAGLGLGIFLYFAGNMIKEIPKRVSDILLILSNLILTGIFIYSSFGHRSKWDFLIIGLYAVCILILTTANPQIKNEKIKSVFSFLGKTTYPIYILQMPVIELILTIIR